MSDRKAVFLLIILCTGVLFLVFGDVIRHPNAYMFGVIGDSIKNYFTFAWYVKFDSGLHFSGMNHPWGEHIVYTDNQPLFSVPLGFIHRHIISLDQHIIGIINSIVFASMAASSVVLYFILRKCLLPAWFAIIGAILIMLLSPQHFVISHQYALTNLLVLPASWLVIIRLFEAPFNFSRYVVYVLVLLAAGLVHPYFLPMGFLLFFGYFTWFAWQRWYNKTGNRKQIATLLFTGLLPIILFRTILFLTENIMDRPENPEGFLEGKTTVAGLLFPVNSLSATFLNAITGSPVLPEPNHSYIGLAAMFCLVLAGAKGIRYLLKKDQEKEAEPVVPKFLQMGLWAGFLILIFSAAIPFRFGLMHWLDYIPPLKQFRVLSRFTWMFYFIFSVIGFFILYQVYRFFIIKNKKILAYSWLSLLLILWTIDALALLKPEVELLHKHKIANEFSGTAATINEMLNDAGQNPANFQMILPVPYYSAGSEKVGRSNWSSVSMYQTMKVAYQTGLPLSTGEMARTSLSQVLLRTQLLSSDSIKKQLLPLLHPTKPLLVMVTDSAEKDYEKRLVAKSRFLVKHNNVSYYELPISRLQQVYSEENADQKVTAIPANVVYQTFAKNQSEKWLFNKGAFTSEKGTAVIFDSILPRAEVDKNYQASVWLNARAVVGMATIWLEEVNAANKVEQKVPYDLRDATEIYQDWLRATFNFKLQNPKNKIRIMVDGENVIADELLIRPVNQRVYCFTNDQQHVVRNNYLLP